MKEETQYYRMFKLDKDLDGGIEFKGNKIHLKSGYYRFNYYLSSKEPEHKFQYSTDRLKWEDIDLCSCLSEFDDLRDSISEKIENVMVFERLEYIETISYRGNAIPVFYDDYGQCFFGIFDNEEMGFGSFNASYEDDIKDMIDYMENKKSKDNQQ